MDDAALCNAAADVLEHWLLTIVLQLYRHVLGKHSDIHSLNLKE